MDTKSSLVAATRTLGQRLLMLMSYCARVRAGTTQISAITTHIAYNVVYLLFRGSFIFAESYYFLLIANSLQPGAGRQPASCCPLM